MSVPVHCLIWPTQKVSPDAASAQASALGLVAGTVEDSEAPEPHEPPADSVAVAQGSVGVAQGSAGVAQDSAGVQVGQPGPGAAQGIMGHDPIVIWHPDDVFSDVKPNPWK